mmetsp:Transcript_7685/g.24064  ORF Transcript_7685/g.24064 Transcript_7685/m.24064 type:complete len:259 (+) Transcript_7685:703-1479(+)
MGIASDAHRSRRSSSSRLDRALAQCARTSIGASASTMRELIRSAYSSKSSGASMLRAPSAAHSTPMAGPPTSLVSAGAHSIRSLWLRKASTSAAPIRTHGSACARSWTTEHSWQRCARSVLRSFPSVATAAVRTDASSCWSLSMAADAYCASATGSSFFCMASSTRSKPTASLLMRSIMPTASTNAASSLKYSGSLSSTLDCRSSFSPTTNSSVSRPVPASAAGTSNTMFCDISLTSRCRLCSTCSRVKLTWLTLKAH